MKQTLQKNKILVITNMYPTTKHKSFGVFIKNQVDALRKRKLPVDVVAIRNPNNGKLNVMTKYGSWLMQTIFTLLAKGRSYQVVHAHYVFPSGYLALMFKRLFHTRMIVTAHGGDIDKMARKSKRLFDLTYQILQEADHVIAVGEELRQRIITDFSVEQQKVSVINMGVNREIFKPDAKTAVRKQLGISEEQKAILFVGNLLEQKGLLDLIAAFSQLKQSEQNAQLYLIGSAKDAYFIKKLKQMVLEKDLSDIVQFLGVKEQTEIAYWMSAADCLVLPSHIEGFGLVALESMACGTPVVGTNVGGLKYLLADGAGEISSVKNPQELANSISKVLSSEETREQLIKNGLIKAEENDQERMLDRVLDVYFPTGG